MTLIITPKEDTILTIPERVKMLYADLSFNEKLHKYTVNKKQLISVTTYLSRFHPEFDTKLMSAAMERKYGKLSGPKEKQKTAKYFTRRWSFQSLEASTSGSRVHEYIEYNAPTFSEEPICFQEKGAKEFFDSLPEHISLVSLEKRIYSTSKEIAGTIDCILYNSQTDRLIIADWKTNMKNLLLNYNQNKLTAPFSHLYHTPLNDYSLQLSLYKAILEENTGIEVESCWVIHLSNMDWSIITDNKKKNNTKYTIDSICPDEIGENYRKYIIQDYSKELNTYISHDRSNRI